jgi:hypothetical protein
VSKRMNVHDRIKKQKEFFRKEETRKDESEAKKANELPREKDYWEWQRTKRR